MSYIIQTCLLLYTSDDPKNAPGPPKKPSQLISLNMNNPSILLQLMELDSKLPPEVRNNELHSVVFTYTIHILKSPPSVHTPNGVRVGTAVGGGVDMLQGNSAVDII